MKYSCILFFLLFVCVGNAQDKISTDTLYARIVSNPRTVHVQSKAKESYRLTSNGDRWQALVLKDTSNGNTTTGIYLNGYEYGIWKTYDATGKSIDSKEYPSFPLSSKNDLWYNNTLLPAKQAADSVLVTYFGYSILNTVQLNTAKSSWLVQKQAYNFETAIAHQTPNGYEIFYEYEAAGYLFPFVKLVVNKDYDVIISKSEGLPKQENDTFKVSGMQVIDSALTKGFTQHNTQFQSQERLQLQYDENSKTYSWTFANITADEWKPNGESFNGTHTAIGEVLQVDCFTGEWSTHPARFTKTITNSALRFPKKLQIPYHKKQITQSVADSIRLHPDVELFNTVDKENGFSYQSAALWVDGKYWKAITKENLDGSSKTKYTTINADYERVPFGIAITYNATGEITKQIDYTTGTWLKGNRGVFVSSLDKAKAVADSVVLAHFGKKAMKSITINLAKSKWSRGETTQNWNVACNEQPTGYLVYYQYQPTFHTLQPNFLEVYVDNAYKYQQERSSYVFREAPFVLLPYKKIAKLFKKYGYTQKHTVYLKKLEYPSFFYNAVKKQFYWRVSKVAKEVWTPYGNAQNGTFMSYGSTLTINAVTGAVTEEPLEVESYYRMSNPDGISLKAFYGAMEYLPAIYQLPRFN